MVRVDGGPKWSSSAKVVRKSYAEPQPREQYQGSLVLEDQAQSTMEDRRAVEKVLSDRFDPKVEVILPQR